MLPGTAEWPKEITTNGNRTIPRVINGVTTTPDGRMFVTDDQDGAVYWIAPRTLMVPTH